jgi:hypothetical protein
VVGPLLSPRQPLSLDWNRGGATAHVNIFYVILKKKILFLKGLRQEKEEVRAVLLGVPQHDRGERRGSFSS